MSTGPQHPLDAVLSLGCPQDCPPHSPTRFSPSPSTPAGRGSLTWMSTRHPSILSDGSVRSYRTSGLWGRSTTLWDRSFISSLRWSRSFMPTFSRIGRSPSKSLRVVEKSLYFGTSLSTTLRLPFDYAQSGGSLHRIFPHGLDP